MRRITCLGGAVAVLLCGMGTALAQKIVGDGVSIDPTSAELLAPVAGEVVQLHGAHHALTLRTDGGLEVLVHIGIDTVMLCGEGFQPLVTLGQRVARGQPLIRFDLGFLPPLAHDVTHYDARDLLMGDGGDLAHLRFQ